MPVASFLPFNPYGCFSAFDKNKEKKDAGAFLHHKNRTKFRFWNARTYRPRQVVNDTLYYSDLFRSYNREETLQSCSAYDVSAVVVGSSGNRYPVYTNWVSIRYCVAIRSLLQILLPHFVRKTLKGCSSQKRKTLNG